MTSSSSPSVTDLLSLKGKVVLLTGATGHLGGAMAAALAEAGATVIVTSRSLDKAEAIGAHHAVVMDHLDESSIAVGFEAAVKVAGRVDVLVANAHEPLAADWTTVTADQFNRQLQNATGYFLLARHFRDHIVARKAQGGIILLGSMYGLVGSYPDVYNGASVASPVAYHCLKGGIIQMTRHLAVYWAKDNIRVNCLSPGPFPSPAAPAAMVERLRAKSPMGRMGEPHELKGPLVFLASDAASFMTGQNLVIDGGWTAW